MFSAQFAGKSPAVWSFIPHLSNRNGMIPDYGSIRQVVPTVPRSTLEESIPPFISQT